MLNHKLHNIISRLHIRHLPLQTQIPHDSRCEDDRDILRRHEINCLFADHPREMEGEEFEDVAVDGWELAEGFAQVGAPRVGVFDCWFTLG